jgi:hypothetical protein
MVGGAIPVSISAKVRQLVIARDSDQAGDPTCQWCGAFIRFGSWMGYSLQHRRARGMGGSRHSTTDSPSNLVLVCGSATYGCHGWIESHPFEASNLGFRLPQSATPSSVPISTHTHGTVYLDDFGGYTRRQGPRA